MNWKTYTSGVLLFNLFGFILLFLLADVAGVFAAEYVKNCPMFPGILHLIQQSVLPPIPTGSRTAVKIH